MDRALKPRRGLRRTDAAAYIGISPSKFDELVRDGRMPNPFRVDNCVIWDVRDLDFAFEALKDPNSQPEENTWRDFEEENSWDEILPK